MKKKFLLLILIILITFTLSSLNKLQAVELKKEGLTELRSIITTDPMLKGAISGISIRSATTGDILYAYNGETNLTPASSFKLFTAIAALTTLGSDYTFKTEISTNGNDNKKGVLKGNVYIKGGGDPSLTVKDIQLLIKQLKEKGIRKIEGDVVADDTRYDRVRYSIDLPWSDETAYYGAQISALTVSPDKDYDAGTMIVQVKPSHKGRKPIITLNPPTNYMVVHNKAKTTEAGSEENINMIRGHGNNEVIIEGSIPEEGSFVKEWISVWDPTMYTLSLFKRELGHQGINVKGDFLTDKTPTKTQKLVEHESEPLSEILLPFLKLSNNTIAESLVKEIGHQTKNQGTWEAGLETEKNTLAQMGIDIRNTVFRDGSGLSHVNTTQPNTLTKLLFCAQDKEWFPILSKSLPVAGEKEKLIGGTLRNRMINSPLKQKVQAKTGTLTNVSSLTGYLQTKTGEKVIFSIILNHLNDEEQGKIIEEKILSILHTWLE